MTFRIVCLAVCLSCVASAQGSGPTWVANDVRVCASSPGSDGAADTRLEIGVNGDARITLDLRGGEDRTVGTIDLIAGRWMLTQGFSPAPGAEIDDMDVGVLNAKLVMRLLSTTLPKGPPPPGAPRRIEHSDKAYPIQLTTMSASAEYGPPWSVSGTVEVKAAGASANYQLKITYVDQGRTVKMNLDGSLANQSTAVSFPDSMSLSGWTIHKVGPYQEQSPDGTKLDYGVQSLRPSRQRLLANCASSSK